MFDHIDMLTSEEVEEAYKKLPEGEQVLIDRQTDILMQYADRTHTALGPKQARELLAKLGILLLRKQVIE